MNSWFSADGGPALYGILADIAGDIVLKTDADGFIEYASPDLRDLGFDFFVIGLCAGETKLFFFKAYINFIIIIYIAI